MQTTGSKEGCGLAVKTGSKKSQYDVIARRQAIRLHNSGNLKTRAEIVKSIADLLEDEARFLEDAVCKEHQAYSSIANLALCSEMLRNL